MWQIGFVMGILQVGFLDIVPMAVWVWFFLQNLWYRRYPQFFNTIWYYHSLKRHIVLLLLLLQPLVLTKLKKRGRGEGTTVVVAAATPNPTNACSPFTYHCLCLPLPPAFHLPLFTLAHLMFAAVAAVAAVTGFAVTCLLLYTLACPHSYLWL